MAQGTALSPIVPSSGNNSPAPSKSSETVRRGFTGSTTPREMHQFPIRDSRPIESAASTARSARSVGTARSAHSNRSLMMTAASQASTAPAPEPDPRSRSMIPWIAKPAWDPRMDAAAQEAAVEQLWQQYRRVERWGLVALAVLDNVLCYVTYGSVRAFHGRMYTIVDLQLTLLPSIDVVLLLFAGIGTVTFVAMLILIECFKLKLFNQIMIFRLYASALPCGFICAVLVFYSEQTQWAPFANLIAILLLVFAWCVHMRVHHSHELNVLWKIILDISWFMAAVAGIVITILFASNSLNMLTKTVDHCPYAANDLMPVRVLAVDRWYCSPWSSRQELSRTPVPMALGQPTQLLCHDSYVSRFGVSIEPHTVVCPQGCLQSAHSYPVIGCDIYALDSPVCIAAIHSGALTDMGGVVTVYGRVGVAHFQRCSRNSQLSEERDVVPVGSAVTLSPAPIGGSEVAAPLVFNSIGMQLEQAFHFNNQPSTEEFIWLQGYETRTARDSSVNSAKPWTRIEATVSSRVAGVEVEDEKVQLGEPRDLPGQDEASESAPANCIATLTGIKCRVTGAAAIHLDFCRPSVKTCPA